LVVVVVAEEEEEEEEEKYRVLEKCYHICVCVSTFV
jgi:hypothetical protein